MLHWLFPPRCLVCREFISAPLALCETCEGRWPRLDPPSFTAPSLEHVFAAGRYKGILLELIVRLKYRKEERLARPLADRMLGVFRPHLETETFDVILPIPLHVKRLRERGFNQALLLGRRIGKMLDISVDPLSLYKKEATAPQAELKREARIRNLKGVFAVRREEKIKGKKVLLVDDVYTTGATMEAAARELLKAGAASVAAVVAARAE